MSVHVKLSTTLRAFAPGYNPLNGLHVDIPPGTTAENLALRLGLPLEQIKIIMINGRHADPDTPLQDGDRIGFFPAVGGG